MMTPALRRFTFTTHITSSVGWVGAALAFLALAVIGFTTDDEVKVRGNRVEPPHAGRRPIIVSGKPIFVERSVEATR